MSLYANSGKKLLIMNFHGYDDPVYNERNIFFDDSKKILDIGDLIRSNVKGYDEDEQEEFEKLIEVMKNFELNVLYVSLNDWIPVKNTTDFDEKLVKFVQIYFLSFNKKNEEDTSKVMAKIDKFIKDLKGKTDLSKSDKKKLEILEKTGNKERLIRHLERLETDFVVTASPRLSKVINTNCVRLEDEWINGRQFPTILAVEGYRDGDLMKLMYKFKESLENVKILPNSWMIEHLQEKVEILEATNEDLRDLIQEIKDDRDIINLEIGGLKPRKKSWFSRGGESDYFG